ncbi:MAG TPA: hypothetical protein VLJ38_13185, partial [Polyangiaceae bacterium]|nr:hypothetical protein [Polyangiaceae bacterium]
AVHTVPLVAVVTLAFRAQRGARAAVERALGLAAASVGGVLLSGSVPASFTQSLSAWIAAAVAGLLLHVVTHDLGRDLPTTPVARAADWAAAALGLVTSTLGADSDLQILRRSLFHAFTTGALHGAPAIALSLAAALLLTRSAARHRLAAFPAPAAALDGAALAATLANLPLGIFFGLGTALTAKTIPLLPGHRLENTPPPSTLSPNPARPHSHPHADPHAHPHADPHAHPHADPHSHSHAGPHSHADPHSDAHATHTPPSPIHIDSGAEFATATTLLREQLAWALTGLVLYALLSASLGPDALARLSLPIALAGAAVCGLPLELPAVTAVFIAAASWQHGLRLEAALAFAVLASLRVPRRLSVLLFEVAAGIGVGLAAGYFDAAHRLAPLLLPLPLSALALALLLATTVFTAWQHGIRGLFAGVFHSHDSA